MSASSETEICNIALTRLGHTVISDMNTDTSKEATLCKLHYKRTRDSALRAHPWNFAIKRVALARETATPNHEYSYSFALPVDCLRVVRTNWEANGFTSQDEAVRVFYSSMSIPYRVEGRKLLCNEETCSIEYIAQIEDTSQFDALFTDFFAQRLAAEIAMNLTDDANMVRTAWQIAGEKLLEARSMDAQEGSARAIFDDSAWVQSRF